MLYKNNVHQDLHLNSSHHRLLLKEYAILFLLNMILGSTINNLLFHFEYRLEITSVVLNLKI